jgi:1-acyl-sn-glycerol-3-phosphate acyltransferase
MFGEGPDSENSVGPKFTKPLPNDLLIKTLAYINRYVLLQGVPLLNSVPVLNKLPCIRGLMNITGIDIPHEDVVKLRQAVNNDTAAFIAANHPEYFTDMLLDKELSMLAFPKMASWAKDELINVSASVRAFWSKVNVISHKSGDAGKEYSIQWALTGKGVLLHPEGTVRWTSDKVHKPYPGVAAMSVEAAKRSLKGDKRPVYVVPIVWKMHFTRDVSRGLKKEMAQIESKLGLPINKGMPVLDQFTALLCNILAQKETEFGLAPEKRQDPITGATYFDRQIQLRSELISRLESRYGVFNGDLDWKYHNLEKAIKRMKTTDPQQYQKDKHLLQGIRYLMGFTMDVYNVPRLTQEHMAESLKRIKQQLFPNTSIDVLKKQVPVPVASRRAQVRVDDPINVTAMLQKGLTTEDAIKARLLSEVQRRMQGKLDEINRTIAPKIHKYSHPNPFYRQMAQKAS